MRSTMLEDPLLVSSILEHGARIHPEARVVRYLGGASSVQTFAGIAGEAGRLAGALRGIGVGLDDMVATLCWNTPAHLAAYLGVPSLGAILHTLNLRLSDEQLVYIINHALDRVVLVDDDLVPQLARILPSCPSVRDVIIVVGDATAGFGTNAAAEFGTDVAVHSYDELLAAADAVTEWPVLDERSAAILCYTTGTTGDPKGVAYSHRSIYLHTMAISTGSAYAFSDADRIMPIVPMFHANAWGWPYAAWLNGSDLVMTGRYLQAEHLARMIAQHRVTAAAAVPTLWSALDSYALASHDDLSSLRLAVVGGSALHEALATRFAEHHGVELTQGWGMTETSPLLTFSRPPAAAPPAESVRYRTLTGRLVPGVQARIMDDDGDELPWNGTAAGEIELRGPTIAGSYFRAGAAAMADKFRDGWLRSGDLATIHPSGWVELKDRLKDGIKSGGEWISSVELENHLAGHEAVEDVAVIGVPDSRWEERPLVCVKVRAGRRVTPEELTAFLAGKVARWWLPDRWTFVSEIPRTSVGKYDKKRIRADYHDGRIAVTRGGAPSSPPAALDAEDPDDGKEGTEPC